MLHKSHYTTGQFSNKANVTVRTIRYYDKEGLLKPSHINESGHRFYSDYDFMKLQKILSLKYLGLTLDEIKLISEGDRDKDDIEQSIDLQLELIREKIEQLNEIEEALLNTKQLLSGKEEIDWNQIINLIQVTNMEKNLITQYKNSQNTSIRIALHEAYKTNPTGWFEWMYANYVFPKGGKILELGCGNGELWRSNKENIPGGVSILLSDSSKGMIEDAKENLKDIEYPISYEIFDCHQIPMEDESMDVIIANHVLFYLKDRDKALSEIYRVLKPDGSFYCSAYGVHHMKEVTDMAKEFDKRIVLSNTNLYEIFGLQNGGEELSHYFSDVKIHHYEDKLEVTDSEPLIAYILSCHGNQQEYIKDRYDEFKRFITRKMERAKKIVITKDAGMFHCRKV